MQHVLIISKLRFLIPATTIKSVLNAFSNSFTFCNDTLDILLLSIKPVALRIFTSISLMSCRTMNTPTCTHWLLTLTILTRSRLTIRRLSLATWRTTGTSCLPKKLRTLKPKSPMTGMTRRRFLTLMIRNQRSVSFSQNRKPYFSQFFWPLLFRHLSSVASLLQDWDKPENIPDPDAKKPDDWDEEMDGEWEPPMVTNPDYKVEDK